MALLSEGRLIALGAPAEVLTREALKAVYGVSVSLVKLDGGGTLTAPHYDSGRVR